MRSCCWIQCPEILDGSRQEYQEIRSQSPNKFDWILEKYLRSPSFYLCQSVLSNCLKSLFYVDCLLGARLEVGNVVLGVTPLLGSLGGHCSVVKVDLVSQHDKRKVVWISWTGLQVFVRKQMVNCFP